ncbi:sensor histidine kinase [Algoriella sp.]|uniref:sensor histidine kinase n=1 Tax=Algoriella sp. TaxID=1872434 RepID=UPI001B09EC5F|nr:sensor histidine kinase [Algoriella sp.]MBO6211433.1 histidine kinase [Algoriella sp.]
MLFRKYLLVFILLFCNQLIFSQFVYTKQYTYESGLPANEILSIYKDSRNFVWAGTRFGVFVKDMENFKMMKRFEKIQFNNIWTITEDSEHNIWLGSYGQGIVKFTGQNFEQINLAKGLVSDRVRKLFLDNDLMYVAAQGGISIIDTKSKKIYNPSFEKNNNLALEAVSFFKYKNKIYVATMDHGVFEVSKTKLKLVNSYNRILYSFLDKNILYLSSNDGVFSISIDDFLANKKTYKLLDSPLIRDSDVSNKQQSVLFAGYDYISGNGIIGEIDGDKLLNQTKNFKIDSEYPNKIFSNPADNLLYVSSLDKGIFEVHLNHFLDYKTIDNRKVIEIISINNLDYFLSPLGLYIKDEETYKKHVSNDDFYRFMQQNRPKYSDFINKKNKDFQEINYDLKVNELRFIRIIKHNSSFWISTNIGLFELDFDGNFKTYLPIRPYYFAFFKNQFIVANSVSGMLIFDDLYNLKYKNHPDSQINVPKDVVSICQNDKAVFFGSSLDGLFKYENGKFTSYLQTNQFKETKLKMIKCVGNNQLMVATEFSKVYIFDVVGEKLIKKNEIDIRKIGGENISSIDVFENKIVIGTNRNLLIVDGKRMFTINNEQGFVDKDIHSSIYDGKILSLGVENGYYDINLNQLIHQQNKPKKVIVTGLKVNDEKYARDKFLWFDLIDRHLKLKNNENNIFIDFSIVNVDFPLNYKYRYRINPQENWSESFNDEFIFFRNLNHGSYKIELEITDTNNGNKQIVELVSLKIAAPFYLNIYFILLSILTLGLIVYKYYSIKISTLNKFNKLKINQLKEKNKQENQRLLLERKLTETRLVALQSQMNPHFIFNVLNSIQYYILDNDVDNAINSLGRFSHLIRQMLNLSTKNEISLNEEIEFLKLYNEVENFRWQNKVNFVVDIANDVDIYKTKIPPMLLQPIVENAFVHAFNQSYVNPTITLNVTHKEKYFVIKIEDNGKGFSRNIDSNKTHESKALKIIMARLHLLNNDKNDDVSIFSDENGTIVTMLLNVDWNNSLA